MAVYPITRTTDTMQYQYPILCTPHEKYGIAYVAARKLVEEKIVDKVDLPAAVEAIFKVI